jgi:hypothetical protein
VISHALAYARRGLRVLPIRLDGTKAPYLEDGVHGASSDEAVVRAWWTRRPAANVAIAIPPSWIVVDVDPRNGGDVELPQLEAKYGSLPATVTARTGGGGAHYIFRRPGAVRLRGKLTKGIDLLGTGRYVLVAPSVHASGHRYAWTSPPGTRLATLPSWIAELARVCEVEPMVTRPIATTADIAERARRYVMATPPAISGSGGHTATFLLAQRLVRGFALDEATAFALMVPWNRTCVPPWSHGELARKVREAARAGRMAIGDMVDRGSA